MKFAVPELRAAFSGQLLAAGLPLHGTSTWLVPAAEIGLGKLFLLGLLVRVASLGGLVLMTAAACVHLVVDEPALFPLQPAQPIVPLVAAALCRHGRARPVRAGRRDRLPSLPALRRARPPPDRA